MNQKQNNNKKNAIAFYKRAYMIMPKEAVKQYVGKFQSFQKVGILCTNSYVKIPRYC